jgi:hypothetical protein
MMNPGTHTFPLMYSTHSLGEVKNTRPGIGQLELPLLNTNLRNLLNLKEFSQITSISASCVQVNVPEDLEFVEGFLLL